MPWRCFAGQVDMQKRLIKSSSWLLALLGLWEFGDIAALLVPDFGAIPSFLWNHIFVGLLLMIAGIWAALVVNPRTAKTLHWIAAAAGVWLILSSLVLRYPILGAGLWNDILVGILVTTVSLWAAQSPPKGSS